MARASKATACVVTLLLALAVAHGDEKRDASPQQAVPRKQVRYVMGTLCEIVAYPIGDHPGTFPSGQTFTTEQLERTDAAISAAFDELKRLDALLSNWKPNSELMKMNAAAAESVHGSRPEVPVGAELFERVQTALDIARKTGGRFDPTVGPLVRAWGFLPDSWPAGERTKRVAEARKRVGWRKVRLDPERHTVSFGVPGMEIDLGGIAKGYASERALQVLRDRGVKAGAVSLGESSISVMGEPASSTETCAREMGDAQCVGWQFYIRDPRQTYKPVGRVVLKDGESLATSGTYEKTTGAGSKRRSHIINPSTGQAIGGAVGVTVVARSGELADALTKAFLLLPTEPERRPGEVARILRLFGTANVMLLEGSAKGLQTSIWGSRTSRFQTISQDQKAHAAEAR
ncbi:MAG TPA: FAD:protein FMN transferase [Clostridia bacterium]|nr:FAD:protein FMN transferase [Clostridia bacterium]